MALFLCWPATVWGQEPDPFAIDTAKWNNVSDFNPKAEEEAAPSRQLVLPDIPSSPPAQLDHPLAVPALPGGAQQPEGREDASSTDAAVETEEPGAWTSPDTYRVTVLGTGKDKQEKTSFKIRLTTLPNAQIAPIPADRVTRPLVDRQAADRGADAEKKKKAAAAPPKPKASPEACEALAALRRRQLEALESDRKTLADLHKALSELGLSEKLSFMDQAKTVPDVLAEQPASSVAVAGATSPAAKPQPTGP